MSCPFFNGVFRVIVLLDHLQISSIFLQIVPYRFLNRQTKMSFELGIFGYLVCKLLVYELYKCLFSAVTITRYGPTRPEFFNLFFKNLIAPLHAYLHFRCILYKITPVRSKFFKKFGVIPINSKWFRRLFIYTILKGINLFQPWLVSICLFQG